MIKRTAILMTTAFMFVTLPGAAVADDQDQIRERLQDGSCLDGDYSTDESGRFILADGQDRDRLQDGSCLDGDYSTDESGRFILADGQDRDRLQDGSCLDGDYSTDSVSFILASRQRGRQDRDGTKDHDRLRDGSCLDYSTDSVNMILADGRQRDKENVKDKLKDCKVIS